MEEKLEFSGCDPKKICCKNCKWAMLIGYLKSSCVKYERKPYEVYYENRDCPKFESKSDR